MNTLFLGLLIAGILVVLAVAVYNWLQVRRLRSAGDAPAARSDTGVARERFEPVLNAADEPESPVHTVAASMPQSVAVEDMPADDAEAMPDREEQALEALPEALTYKAAKSGIAPDTEIECVVLIKAAPEVPASTLASALATRLGKPTRWLGRRGEGLAWEQVATAGGSWSELAACMLLADRAGAATRDDVEQFLQLIAHVSPAALGTAAMPNIADETARADALDRICADLDVQVGLTILRSDLGQIAGTRLRGVAEAAGFRLNANGKFDYVQEETGAALFSMQNYKAEAFTVESLRLLSTPGVVLVLDVPRVLDPVKVFDQLRLIAKRMTQTLEAVLVDDNRRPLGDAALAEIRGQVQATVAALRAIGIDPGSPRALRLFG